jgi:hypothetical protein
LLVLALLLVVLGVAGVGLLAAAPGGTGRVLSPALAELADLASAGRSRLCDAFYPQRPTRYTFDWFSCDRLVPAHARRIKAMPNIQRFDDAAHLQPKYTTSVWHVGAVLASDRSHYGQLFVWSAAGDCMLGIDIHNAAYLPRQLFPQHDRRWPCPNDLADLGELTITGASGPQGVVSFRSSSGQRGTFDLATQQWQLADDE